MSHKTKRSRQQQPQAVTENGHAPSSAEKNLKSPGPSLRQRISRVTKDDESESLKPCIEHQVIPTQSGADSAPEAAPGIDCPSPISPSVDYEDHPIAAAFPLMSEADLDLLATDIAANGLHEPVVLFEGKILDGRCRSRACKRAGVPIRVTELPSGVNPVAFVLGANMRRRVLLDKGQRAAVAVTLAAMYAEEAMKRQHAGKGPDGSGGRGRKRSTNPVAEVTEGFGSGDADGSADHEPKRTRDRVAHLMGVSSTLVGQAAVVNKYDPNLFEQVRLGQTKLAQAHRKVEESQRGHSPTKRQTSNTKGGDKSERSRSGGDGKAAERDADPAKGSNLHEGDPDSAAPVTLPARKQLGLDLEPKAAQSEFNLESRWARIEAFLCGERELWPVELHQDLCVRVIGLVRGWVPKEDQHLPTCAEPVPAAIGEMIAKPGALAAPAPNTGGQATCRVVFAHWDKVNWRLHNRDLATIWNLTPDTFRQRRFRKKHGPANDAGDAAYREALEKENAKARAAIAGREAGPPGCAGI